MLESSESIVYCREHIKESNVFKLEFPSGPNIYEFKNICVCLAEYLGYHKDNIQEAFGVTSSLSLINDIKIISYEIKP